MKRSFGVRIITYPLLVFLVGIYDNNGRPDMIAASCGHLLLGTVRHQRCDHPLRYTPRNIIERNVFTRNIPSVDQMAEAAFFGKVSGSDIDKFAQTAFISIHVEQVHDPLSECVRLCSNAKSHRSST